MYCVGLTGNIAAGKSSAANCFKKLGIEIINADLIARELTNNNTIFTAIKEHFGKAIINAQGQLDRAKLRQIIFAHRKERLWLECLLHPQIKKEILRKVTQVNSAYCIVEIPLLYNRQDFPYIDRVLLITAPCTLKVCRLMHRDLCSAKHAKEILATQVNPHKHQEIADDIISNDSTLAVLASKIKILHNNYLNFSHHVI